MRTPLLICWLAWAACAQAQFYMTDVCLHDAAQRLFVVEAARVHAWIENTTLPENKRITAVTWQVEGELDGKTRWQIIWKNAEGVELRRVEVAYEGKELLGGSAWFRRVWHRIREIERDEDLPETPDKAASMTRAYWEGAGQTGKGRMSGVLAAVEFAGEKEAAKEPEAAAALAGMLTHSAMPMLGGACLLDHLLLARSAAWLCHAEETAQVRLRFPWLPLGFLAGREAPVAKSWQQAGEPDSNAELVERWWDLVMRNRPASARDLVLFAAEPGHADLGLPFLLAHLRMDAAHKDEFNRVVQMLYGSELEQWPDLGAAMMRLFSVNGPQSFYSRFPALARLRWLQTLGHVAAVETGGKHPDLAAQAVEAMRAIGNDKEGDPVLRGLAVAGGLIDRGYDLRTESLEPVAVVSAEDLLVFGWDMSLDTMQAWHAFLNRQLGVADAAAAVRDACKAAPSLLPFLERRRAPGPPPAGKKLDRLEFFETPELATEAILWLPPDAKFEQAKVAPGRAGLRNLFKRGGMATTSFSSIVSTLGRDVFQTTISMLARQAGEDVVSRIHQTLVRGMPPNVWAEFKEKSANFHALLEKGSRNAKTLHRELLLPRTLAEMTDHLERAQGLERLYWEAPDPNTATAIFDYYTRANAMNAAKRFYGQAAKAGGGNVSFSNQMPLRRWALAWWEKDEAAMESAARDAPSFSSLDLEKQIVHCLATGRDEKAASLVEASMQRYPSRDEDKKSSMEVLRDFLPLIPSLKDESHARHEEALDFLADSPQWVFLRLVLARRFDLSVEKTARLLREGKEPPNFARAALAHLRGNKEALIEARQAVYEKRGDGLNGASMVLLECMNHDLLKTPTPGEQPDLRPDIVERLDELVMRKLKAAQ